MTNKRDFKKLLWVVGGALILEKIFTNSDTIVGGISNVVSALTGSHKDFVTTMAPIADEILTVYNIHPLITMMQSAEESRWGSSGLTAKANNLFGYTANQAWITSGKSVLSMPSSEHSNLPPEKIQYWNTAGDIISKTSDGKGGTNLKVNIAFRKYPTWYDSVSDWANLISTKAIYASAYTFAQAGDFENFAYAVQQAGYATDPAYATTLIAVANEVQSVQTA